MKLYAGNTDLAGQLLETAFAILRNEGLQPVDSMALVYSQLAGVLMSVQHKWHCMITCDRSWWSHDGEQRHVLVDTVCRKRMAGKVHIMYCLPIYYAFTSKLLF